MAVSTRLEQARTAFTKALNAAIESTNPCAEGLAAYGLGHIARRVSFQDAESWFVRADAAFTLAHSSMGLARTHYEVGGVYSTQGKEKLSEEMYRRTAIELEQAGDPVSALYAKLSSRHYDGNDTRGFTDLQHQAQFLKAPCTEASILQTWGDRVYNEAKYEAAMLHYQDADAVFQKCPGDLSGRSGLQTSMGRLERQHGRPDMALPHYRIALKLQQQEGDPSYIPQTYNAMAVAYKATHDSPRAIVFIKRGRRSRTYPLPALHRLPSSQPRRYLPPRRTGRTRNPPPRKSYSTPGLGLSHLPSLLPAWRRIQPSWPVPGSCRKR